MISTGKKKKDSRWIPANTNTWAQHCSTC